MIRAWKVTAILHNSGKSFQNKKYILSINNTSKKFVRYTSSKYYKLNFQDDIAVLYI